MEMQVNLSLIMTQLISSQERDLAKCFTNTGKGLVLSAGQGGEGKAVPGTAALRK